MSSEMLKAGQYGRDHGGDAVSLHLGEVRSTNLRMRVRLKCCGMTNSRQLLQAAGPSCARTVLSGKTGMATASLACLV